MTENEGTNRVIRTPQECERTCHMVACITYRTYHAIKIVCSPATAIPLYFIFQGVVLCHCEFLFELEDSFPYNSQKILVPAARCSSDTLTLYHKKFLLGPPLQNLPKSIFFCRSSLFLFSYYFLRLAFCYVTRPRSAPAEASAVVLYTVGSGRAGL